MSSVDLTAGKASKQKKRKGNLHILENILDMLMSSEGLRVGKELLMLFVGR